MATNIKVLLKEDVDKLGSGGEVVRVRAGFARNFLLPRGLALPATQSNLSRVEELKRAAAQRATQEQEKAQDLARQVSGLSVRIARAVGDEGKMYGSVTSKDIAEAAARAGVTIDRRRIELAEPLKQLGTFEVMAKLHQNVTAKISVEIVKS